MEKANILFLDIDSVLNSSSYAESVYDDNPRSNKLVEVNVPICKANYNALKSIYDNVDNLKIVWSTDWRMIDEDVWNGWKNPLKWLESQSWFKPLVIGRTPKKMSSTRPEEIHMWFRDNIYNKQYADKDWMNSPWFDIRSYAIVDDWDSNMMYKFGKHFFKTCYDTGLTENIARKIVECLKSETYNEEELDWRRRDD